MSFHTSSPSEQPSSFQSTFPPRVASRPTPHKPDADTPKMGLCACVRSRGATKQNTLITPHRRGGGNYQVPTKCGPLPRNTEGWQCNWRQICGQCGSKCQARHRETACGYTQGLEPPPNPPASAPQRPLSRPNRRECDLSASGRDLFKLNAIEAANDHAHAAPPA